MNHGMSWPEEWCTEPSLREVADLVSAHGLEATLVGGCIRDVLLGRPVDDWDIIVSGDPKALGRELARAWRCPLVPLDVDFGVYRLRPPGGPSIDLSRMQGETLEQDLRGRDLTINAIGVPLEAALADEQRWVDPTGGLHDLGIRRVRVIDRTNLIADPIRLLRVFRIAGALDFAIEPVSLGWVAGLASEIRCTAGERVLTELAKLLALPHAARWLELMRQNGLLAAIWPTWDSKLAMRRVALFEELDARWPELWPGDGASVRAWLDAPLAGGRSRRILLKLGALCGPSATPQHAAMQMGSLLKLSAREIAALAVLFTVPAEPRGLPGSAREIHRFFRDRGDFGVGHALLCLVQAMVIGEVRTLEPRIRIMLEAYFRHHDRIVAPAPLLTGHDLMAHFRLRPGPLVGETLTALVEAQAGGELLDRAAAIAWVGALLERRGHEAVEAAREAPERPQLM